MGQAQSLAGEAASYAAVERLRASNSTSGVQQSDLIATQTSAAAIASDSPKSGPSHQDDKLRTDVEAAYEDETVLDEVMDGVEKGE